MAFEIPSELIRDLRAGLRREAGVPDYDPSDPALPPLPSIPDAVAALDPSLPLYLRCRRCRGGLLRGLRSTICVYCGAEQCSEGPTHSISFKSTAACRRFLESLDLDGSEIIGLDPEEKKSSKGDDSPKDGTLLSDLLDLEISWSSVKRDRENISITKGPSQSTYALNMSGVDLDTFFTNSKNELISSANAMSDEQMISGDQIKSTEKHTLGLEDLGFFENIRSSETRVSSTNKEGGEFGDSFADWEGEFQFASSESIVTDSKSVDLFQNFPNPSVDPLRSMATMDQSADIKNVGGINANRKGPNDENGQMDTADNFIQDDLWAHTDKDAGYAANPADQLKAIDKTSNDELKNNMNNTTLESESWHQDDSWFTTGTVESKKTGSANRNDDSSDEWQDFTTSVNTLEGQSDFQTQVDTRAAMYGNSLEGSNRTKSGDDDSFHDRKDLTSSIVAREEQSDFQTHIRTGTTVHEISQETNLNSQDMDFNSFFNSDSSSGAQGGQKGLNDVNDALVDAPGFDGMHEKNGAFGTIPEAAGTNNDDPAVDSKVAMLLSQMHDLSFMLKDELSIPSKPENSDSNS